MNKLQGKIAILFLVCVAQFRANAQNSVTYASELGQRPVWTSAGVPLPDNNEVVIGYFDDGFVVADNAGDLEALLPKWHRYDGTTIYTDEVGEGGHFYAPASSNDPAFVGKQIWLWVFKTPDNSAPSADLSDVTEYGLFSSSSSAWRFPPAGTFPANHTDINTDQVNVIAWGSLSGGHLNLAAEGIVPEPASGVLLAAGFSLLGLFTARRRK
jgi:hypothetical protein